MAPLTLRRHTATVQHYIESLSLQPGDLPLTLILIPPGTFQMGSPGEEGDYENEKPQHSVTVPAFVMGRYPITQAQWAAVAAFPQSKIPLKMDPSHFKGNNRPVEQVSWDDVVEFCERLAAHSQRPYRLPSEAEWEYACRAGTTTPFHFGETLSPEVANYKWEQTYGTRGIAGKSANETTPVDQFKIANRLGLCDLHGNAWEWCQDDWHENYNGAPEDGSAWLENISAIRKENASTVVKVVRSGSWIGHPRICRSAWRDRDTRDARNNDIGFRVCCLAPRGLH